MNNSLPDTIYIHTDGQQTEQVGKAALAVAEELDRIRYAGRVCICGEGSASALASLKKLYRNLRLSAGNEFPLPEKAVSYKCNLPFRSLFINPDGECVLCHIDKTSSVKMGDALSEPLDSIWTGEKYTAVRHAHENGQTDTLPLCSFCPLIFHPPKMAEKDIEQFDNEFDNVPEGKYAP